MPQRRGVNKIQVISINSNVDWDIIFKLFNGVRFIGDCWVRGNDSTVYTSIKYNDKIVHAHRVSYELFTGIKIFNYGCHHCDVKACINPDHIFDGTARQNSLDARRKRRVFDISLRGLRPRIDKSEKRLKEAYANRPVLIAADETEPLADRLRKVANDIK